MGDSLGMGSGTAAGSVLDRQTDALLRRFSSSARPAPGPSTGPGKLVDKIRDENARIDKSARDFESILLGSWLEQAEQSFAKVPGGDDEDEDVDPGGEQLKGMATQSLASSLAASGGIGIAKMISAQLHKAADTQSAAASQPAASQSTPARTGPSPPGGTPASPPGLPAK